MIHLLLSWFAAILFTEALVEILVESDIFFKLRNLIVKVNPGFLGKLVICGYCMSIWCAVLAWFLPGALTGIFVLDVLVRTLCLHRMSNVLHELFVRWFKRLPLVIVFNQVKDLEEEDPEIDIPDDEPTPK